jgi:hypothetical protein
MSPIHPAPTPCHLRLWAHRLEREAERQWKPLRLLDALRKRQHWKQAAAEVLRARASEMEAPGAR